MKVSTPAVIIRPAHQWTGILLIFFIGAKLLSGLNLSGAMGILDARTAAWLHFSKWIDIPLLFLFCFHAAYGLLRLFISKVQKKWLAFFIASGVALVLFLAEVGVMYL
jgi:hypothetical protein